MGLVSLYNVELAPIDPTHRNKWVGRIACITNYILSTKVIEYCKQYVFVNSPEGKSPYELY